MRLFQKVLEELRLPTHNLWAATLMKESLLIHYYPLPRKKLPKNMLNGGSIYQKKIGIIAGLNYLQLIKYLKALAKIIFDFLFQNEIIAQ